MDKKHQVTSMFKLNDDEIESLKTEYMASKNDEKQTTNDIPIKSDTNDNYEYESFDPIPQAHLLTYDSKSSSEKKTINKVPKIVIILTACLISLILGIILTLIFLTNSTEDDKNISAVFDIESFEISSETSESEADKNSEASEVSQTSEMSEDSHDAVVNEMYDITGMRLNKTEFSIGKGEVANLTPIFTPSDTENTIVTWTSSDSSIVDVSNGLVIGYETGTATITAETINGITAECIVTVKNAPSELTLSDDTITVNVGEKYSLTSVLPDGTASESRVYSTSDSSIIKMTRNYWQGEFIALKAGVAYVTVKTYNGLEAKCKVIVNESGENNLMDYSDAITEIKLNKGDISIGKGEIANLIPSLEPSDTENNIITWTSSDTSIVDVSTGMITGINNGTATITAETINGKTAECIVTVKDEPSSVKLSDETVTIKVGESYSLTAVLPEGSASESRVYSTSDSSIVKMTRNYWQGEFIGLKTGVAYVTVKTYNGMESTCKIIVE